MPDMAGVRSGSGRRPKRRSRAVAGRLDGGCVCPQLWPCDFSRITSRGLVSVAFEAHNALTRPARVSPQFLLSGTRVRVQPRSRPTPASRPSLSCSFSCRCAALSPFSFDWPDAHSVSHSLRGSSLPSVHLSSVFQAPKHQRSPITHPVLSAAQRPQNAR